jgi:hypothetical protein
MSRNTRTLIGSAAILAFLALYVWAATAVADLLPPKPWAWILFYPIVGTAWGLPLIPLLSWMNKGR